MTSPIEVLFSIYLVPRPPFVARLTRNDVVISDRLIMVCYSKANGEMSKFDLSKIRRRVFDVEDGDNIRAIRVIQPNNELISILSIPDSETIIYYSGYQWKWTADYEFLRAFDGASAFYLTSEESRKICKVIQSAIQEQLKGGQNCG